MAATISELIIAASVDPQGVKTGLERAGGYLRTFGKTAEQELNDSFRSFKTAAPERAGIEAGRALLGGLTNTFKNSQTVLTEQLARGIISRDQFIRAGQQASQAFNQSLLTGLEILRARGLVEAGSDIERTLVQSLHQAGIRAGEANARGIAEGMQRTAGAGWPGRGPGLQVFDRNAAPAVVAVAYGLESVARSAASAEGGIRAATRSVATFAAGFGPGGVVVTAVIAAGTALYEFWNRQKQQATEAREHLEKELGNLANAGDAAALSKKAREAYLGTPFDEQGKARPVSTLAKGAFEGSLADVRAQLASLQDQFYKETNGFRQRAIQQRIIDVKAQLAPLEADFKAINEAAQNIASQLADNEGRARTIAITARSPFAKAKKDTYKMPSDKDSIYKPLQTEAMDPERTARAAIERVRLIREATGEFSDETLQAEKALTQLLDGVTQRIYLQGGILRSPTGLIAAQRDLKRELEDQAKGRGSEIWGTDDSIRLQAEIKAGLKGIGAELKENTDQWTAMRQGIQGVLDTASGLGLISAGLSKIGGGAIHALDSFRTLQKVRAPGGDGMSSLAGISATLGVVGGVVGAVAGLAQMFTQHDAALDRNTERLETLRTAMVDTRGLSGQTTALAAIQQWVSRGGGGGMSSGNGNQGLDAIVKSLGLTTDQFHKIATELGIEFSKGTDWIIQFQAALEMAIKSANRFSDSLGDQTALSQLRNKVYGKDSPADALSSTIALLNQFAPKLGAAFDGLDTTTEEGRQKIQTALQALFEQLANAALSPEDFGKLAGAKELASIIDTLQSSLTSLAKSASGAAESLLYVPEGYRIALARFEATTPVPGPWEIPSAPPATPQAPAGPGVMQQLTPGSANDTSPSVIVNGDVLITARELSPDDLFASVLKAAQRRAQATFGRSDQWARVQSAN